MKELQRDLETLSRPYAHSHHLVCTAGVTQVGSRGPRIQELGLR